MPRKNKKKELLRSQLCAHIASVTDGYASSARMAKEHAEYDVKSVLNEIVKEMP